MNWANEKAGEVVNSVGFRENPEAAIAAFGQWVADECAAIADYLTGPADDIRARFPKEGA